VEKEGEFLIKQKNQRTKTTFISTIAAKIINLSYFCGLYLILLTYKVKWSKVKGQRTQVKSQRTQVKGHRS